MPDGTEGRTVKTVWFNAWKYPDEDTVLAGLLGALVDRMRRGSIPDQAKLFTRQKAAFFRKILDTVEPGLADRLLPPDEARAPGMEKLGEKRAFHDAFRDLFLELS